MTESEPMAKELGLIERERVKTVRLQTVSELPPEAHRWIWKGWLAAESLHVLAGAPATGKTTAALSLAATLSRGGTWPDGTDARPAHAVIWSGEDHATKTLSPRLLAMGADPDRVSIVTSTSEHGRHRPFDPATDLAELKRTLSGLADVDLLIIDPIISVVTGDSHKNAEVRRSLQPLVDLASSVGCALLGITHFSKGTAGLDPIERISGSLAFGALARVVLVAARTTGGSDADPDRMFIRAKSNIGPDGDGFSYGVEGMTLPHDPEIETSRVNWGVPLVGQASDLLAQYSPKPTAASSDGGRADWLKKVLAAGPVLATEVIARAREELHCPPASLHRARERIGAHTTSVGALKSKKNYWYLSGQEGQIQALRVAASTQK